MFCPKCGNEIAHSSQCLKCGINIDIYKRSKSISIKLYNKSLEQINNNDFSAAIISLIKSLEFDKANHNSRNLLGLIYFEIGEIGKALKQWVISNSLVKENNLAKEYIDTVQNSTNKLEKYNDAIKMYNKALEYANQKSEDMAIIQLKKALDLNPKFLEAYNFLALCYICEKDDEKALTYIEKALEIDIANEKALSYYIEIKQSTQRNLKIDKNIKNNSSNKYSSKIQADTKIQVKTSIFSKISGFIFGAVVMAIVIFVLVIPATKEKYSSQIAQLTESNNSMKEDLDNTLNLNNESIKKLEENNKNIQAENEALKQQLDEKEQVQQVQQVSELYNNGNKEESAKLLLSLSDKYTAFPEETKILYDSLTNKILPDLSKTYYNDGKTKYNAKKYDEARVLFENSFAMSGEQSFSGDNLYYIGRIDEINGNIENAKIMYQRVINDYPKSAQFYYAKTRLAGLNK